MLRALLALLLLANLAFFGWTSGWFGPAWPAPGMGEREPARLAAQVAPERVTVLTPAAASAALAASKRHQACLQAAAAPEAAASQAARDAAEPQDAASAAAPGASRADALRPCEPGA